jgi:hypothetical protein
MGGQACVFYGAAEFSRDLDLLILADPENLERLETALRELDADIIAVPGFDRRLLLRGHAVHFRCRWEPVANLRIDLMASLRGLPDFEDLWERRTTIDANGQIVDLLSVDDLVRAKKTQRDKDWPMIRRLVEQSYFSSRDSRDPAAVEFWFRELRTPELLVRLAAEHPEEARASTRPAVAAALLGKFDEVQSALEAEQRGEVQKDREYWDPLKRELERLRLERGRKKSF